MSVPVEMTRARDAGIRAARNGAPRTGSPYRPDGPTARERTLWRMWHAGYATVNPIVVDYSDDGAEV